MRRALNAFGKILIGLGVVVLLFVAYQIWGTSIQESHSQAALHNTLLKEANDAAARKALAVATALEQLPTGPPVAAPTINAPAEGQPIGYIRIPVIGVNQVVVEGTNEGDLRLGPGHYSGTPLPGNRGNASIAGHRTTYGHPFYNLDSVKVGDPIVLTTLQGVFEYEAMRTLVVVPTDVGVIAHSNTNMLTLTTCNPRYSAATRLVVQARLAHTRLFPINLPPARTQAHTVQSNDLAGDDGGLSLALMWGALILAVGAVVLLLAHRFRRQRWPIYVTGSAGLLVLLYLFFGALSPLLPASL
jgi:sortase A